MRHAGRGQALTDCYFSMMENEHKRACYHCVDESYLKREIKRICKIRRCTYCRKKAASISVSELADRVEEAFREFFQRTSQEPTSWEHYLMSDRESDYQWERHGSPVIDAIMEAAEVDEDIASDVQEVLGERFFDFDLGAMGEEVEFAADSHYERTSPNDEHWQRKWEEFERRLKTETRHFNQFGIKLLDSIFNGIGEMKAADGGALVKRIGPNTDTPALIRARVFQSEEKLREALLEPDKHLGPPPPQYALPGRMNARGVSMFYCAVEEEVAIAEVRPPVGSMVATTRFNLCRELRLLDLSAVNKVVSEGSIFDPKYPHMVQRNLFLRRLSKRVSAPVMPEDETMDYLITQAIADYLATEAKPTFDGILYPSAQKNDKSVNIVLFFKSARVHPSEWSLILERNYTDDEEENSYTIRKTSRPTDKKRPIYDDDMLDVDISDLKDGDERECVLEVDVDTIKIKNVVGIDYDIDSPHIFLY